MRAARAVLGVERLGDEPAARGGLRGELGSALEPAGGAADDVRDGRHERGGVVATRARLERVAREHADRALAAARSPTAALLRTPSSATARGNAVSAAQSGTTSGLAGGERMRARAAASSHRPPSPRCGRSQRHPSSAALERLGDPAWSSSSSSVTTVVDGVAHQRVERQAGEREAARGRRPAPWRSRRRELGDVLGEAVDAHDAPGLVAHRHAAPAQRSAGGRRGVDREHELVGLAVAQRVDASSGATASRLSGDDRSERVHELRGGSAGARARRGGRAPPTSSSGRGDVPAPAAHARHPLGAGEPLAALLEAVVRAPALGDVERDHRDQLAAAVVERVDADQPAALAPRLDRRLQAAAAAPASPRPRAATPPRPRRPRPAAPR